MTLLGGDPITTTYVYDGLGRLTAETKGEDSIAYTYDASGNRIGMNQNGTVTTYAYDANNRLLSETVGDTATAYTYDANGNALTAGDKTYTYNDRGQQSGFTNETVSASYAYNPSGLRNMKTVGGSTKYFVYNGMNIVYEYSESVADGVTYFYGLNRTHNSDGEIYLYNAHGDVVQLVKNNAVVASYTYDAFGNLTAQIGESGNPFLYCGEYYDAETQTYYLRARYYNPANGRFNAEDTHWNLSNMLYGDSPVKLNEHKDALGLNRYTMLPDILAVRQSGNLYAYCVANPVRYVDKTGDAAIEVAVAVGGIIAEAATYAFLIATAVAATVICVDTVSTAIASWTAPIEKEKVVAKEKVAVDTAPSPETPIYRYGDSALVPTDTDCETDSGLSFSLKPPAKVGTPYYVTTIEKVNATGILAARVDHGNHVRIDPTICTLKQWQNGGLMHPCTVALTAICVKGKR